MARMLRANLIRKGPCHPWCEPPVHAIGHAAEYRTRRRSTRSITRAQAHRIWVAGDPDHDERTCAVCAEGERHDRRH